MERQTEKHVKAIRSDNGTEFKNGELNHFCAKRGIARHFTAAYTPQQNGVAERRNRTLIEAARTMLCDSKLPVFFWAHAVDTACYVQNRVLVNKCHMKTPYEILYGHPPSVAHFKVFGCICTLMHLGPGQPKFSAKGDECYFIEYAGKTAHKVYNRVTKQIVESFDVTWLEENQTDAGIGPDWYLIMVICLNHLTYLFLFVQVIKQAAPLLNQMRHRYLMMML